MPSWLYNALALSRFAITEQWQLLDRNCWPDFSLHYGVCCSDEIPPDPRCFADGKTRQQCCGCIGANNSATAARAAAASASETGHATVEGPSALGVELSRHFFGPLLCDGPSVKVTRDDFLVTEDGGARQRLLRVFVYRLPRKFNGDLLNRLQLGGWSLGSECDYGLTLCTEEKWNGLFSVYRQFATEVLVLLKFLAAPPGVLTQNPNEADLFVVPYFAKTDCAESGNAGADPCWGKCKCATAVKHLFAELRHYNWGTRGRHLFLATGDIKDLPVEIQAQPLIVSLGASFCGGHVVVPSPNLDPVLQPGGRFELLEVNGMAPDRHIFAYWFGANDKRWRQRVLGQLIEYGRRPDARLVVVHDIGCNYAARDVWQTEADKPSMVLEEMYRSIFCPILQGDVPHQKRLFDAMLTGCLPVVVAFPSHVPGKVSWWLPGGPPVERMLPYAEDVDYRSFVVEVPQSEVDAGRVVDALLRIPDEEIQRRRDAMRLARPFVRFDFGGSGPDAFSMTVRALWRALKSQADGAERNAAPKFDCGVPPWQSEGILMYGHMACCPVDENLPEAKNAALPQGRHRSGAGA